MTRVPPVRADPRARGPFHLVRRHPVITLLLALSAAGVAVLIVRRIPVFSLGDTFVVVTAYEVAGGGMDAAAVVTIERVTRHPATRVRLEGSGASRFMNRIEYVQIDGLISLAPGADVFLALAGDAVFTDDEGRTLARPIRTKGNSCRGAGWPRQALQVTEATGRFTVRVPVSDNPVGRFVREAIQKRRLPGYTIGLLYPSTTGTCAPLDGEAAASAYHLEVAPSQLGRTTRENFYPAGELRFADRGPGRRPYWREWVAGLEFDAFR